MRKFALSAVVAAFSTSAFSSFELVLVADTVKNTIHRFDGESGAYLGSFGKTKSSTWGGSVTSMVIKQQSNEVVVNHGFILARYNYNTGALLGNVSLNTGSATITPTNMSLTRDGKSILVTNNTNQIFRFDAGTFAYQTTYSYTAAMKIFSAAETETGVFVGQNTQTAGSVTMTRLTTSGTMNSATTLTGSGGQMTTMPYNDISYWAGTGSDWTRLGVCSATGGPNMSMQGMISATTLGTAYLTVPLGDVTLTTVQTVAQAHTGFYAGGKDASGNNMVYRLDNGYTSQGVFGQGIISSNVAMGSVIAPEPGTWVAMVAGIGALALRRRNRK